jgi:hypothetical protein
MDEETFKELMEAKLALMQLQINQLSERLDKVINNLKWVLGLMCPILTVALQKLSDNIHF